ncbi:MAG: terpene cyclase/mutase family protein [Planctomycetes bacterium]|nr:terpene cyclase/mutase family protein [Planctomycetota bacterium]
MTIKPLDIDVNTDVLAEAVPMEMVSNMVPEDVTNVAMSNDIDAAAISVDLVDFGEETAPKNDLYKTIGSFSGSGLDGRGAAARGALVAKYGGNEASEAAVAAALKWLAAVQVDDGGWCFDHRMGTPNPARMADHTGNLVDARNGATAMGLLPFLGAGQTHMEGTYKPTVKGGLAFLMTKMKNDGGLNESGGNMYSHGLAAITLCEAYGMTKDRALMAPAQASLNFIAYAQDPIGGGWRYSPRQPGDTSVVGWQLMALKSGHMAYLQVSPNTVRGAIKFLDSVQVDSGAYYGYTSPAKRETTTAVGLLCRMYLGWKHDNDALKDGVKYLANIGPSKSNMYYNYYATQVMRQFGDDYWDAWNKQMRDFLVSAQAKDGPAKGSWYFDGGHGAERGGRVYNTSLATMILEVYYRHLPIYQKQATTEEFPL